MLLKNLIKKVPKNKRELVISGLSENSKKSEKNYIFFAIKGHKINGEKFIKDAINKGATVIVCSKNCKVKNKQSTNYEKKIRNFLGEIASNFIEQNPKILLQ